jgi:hypothetical protein
MQLIQKATAGPATTKAPPLNSPHSLQHVGLGGTAAFQLPEPPPSTTTTREKARRGRDARHEFHPGAPASEPSRRRASAHVRVPTCGLSPGPPPTGSLPPPSSPPRGARPRTRPAAPVHPRVRVRGPAGRCSSPPPPPPRTPRERKSGEGRGRSVAGRRRTLGEGEGEGTSDRPAGVQGEGWGLCPHNPPSA